MKPPTISIGLPVFDGEKLLGRALDCILAQDFGDFELIISDNASTDGTRAICERYVKQDSRVRYFRNEVNCGVNRNHDRVFELSTGKYFLWAAHDVELLPGALSKCAEVMQKAPSSVVLVYPQCEMVCDGQLVRAHEGQNIESRDPQPHMRLVKVIRNVLMVNQLYGLAKREVLARTRLNGDYPASDYVLLAELAMLGEIWEIPYVFLRRKVDSDRGTAAVKDDQNAWWAWLNPTKKRPKGLRLPFRERLALEYLRGAWHVPLRLMEKLLCLVWILPVYYERTSPSVRWLVKVTGPLRRRIRLSKRFSKLESYRT